MTSLLRPMFFQIVPNQAAQGAMIVPIRAMSRNLSATDSNGQRRGGVNDLVHPVGQKVHGSQVIGHVIHETETQKPSSRTLPKVAYGLTL